MSPLRSGFPWWVPLATATAAVLIAVVISTSVEAAFEAKVRLWVKDDRPPAEYAALIQEPSLAADTAGSMMSSESGQAEYTDLSVELQDTLIILTVRAPQAHDAELLALNIASAAVDEAAARFGAVGLQMLGLAQPEPRRAAQHTGRNAALAAAAGLIGGFALAAAVARPTRDLTPVSALGRIGRAGLRTIAVLPVGSLEPAPRDGEPPASARQLAEALDVVDRSAAIVTVFIPLDASVDGYESALQSGRALAGRDHRVIWLDARPPAYELVITTPPPLWLDGPHWESIARVELIQRQLQHFRRRPQQILMLAPDLSDPDAPGLAAAADRVVLIASPRAAADELAAVRARLRGAHLVGVALAEAAPADTEAFDLAQAAD